MKVSTKELPGFKPRQVTISIEKESELFALEALFQACVVSDHLRNKGLDVLVLQDALRSRRPEKDLTKDCTEMILSFHRHASTTSTVKEFDGRVARAPGISHIERT